MTNTTEAKIGILVTGAEDVIPLIVHGLGARPSEFLSSFCSLPSPRVIRMSAEDFILAFAKASGITVTIDHHD